MWCLCWYCWSWILGCNWVLVCVLLGLCRCFVVLCCGMWWCWLMVGCFWISFLCWCVEIVVVVCCGMYGCCWWLLLLGWLWFWCGCCWILVVLVLFWFWVILWILVVLVSCWCWLGWILLVCIVGVVGCCLFFVVVRYWMCGCCGIVGWGWYWKVFCLWVFFGLVWCVDVGVESG